MEKGAPAAIIAAQLIGLDMRSLFIAVCHRPLFMAKCLKIVTAGLSLCFVIAASLVVAGCGMSGKQDPFAGTGSPMYKGALPIPKGGGRRHIGKPYVIAGNKFYPKADPTYDETGIASWYGPKFHKRMTSNGEWFDMDYRSAAHPTLPLPSYAKVTNLDNGRQMIVRVNDRGPFVGDRIIDLSRKSADILKLKQNGTGRVRVQYIGPAPLDDRGTHLAAMNDELLRGTPLHQMIARVDGGRHQMAAAQPQQFHTATVPPRDNGNYFIQVAAFSDQGNAHRTKARLSGIGPVVITPVSAEFGTIYRVRMGPLTDEASARSALDQVVVAGHHDAHVVRLAQY